MTPLDWGPSERTRPVNKAELVAQVARESDLSKDAAEKAVDAMFKNTAERFEVCEIPPPTDDDRGVIYLQAKIQVGPGR